MKNEKDPSIPAHQFYKTSMAAAPMMNAPKEDPTTALAAPV
jgi:hypothetical protein